MLGRYSDIDSINVRWRMGHSFGSLECDFHGVVKETQCITSFELLALLLCVLFRYTNAESRLHCPLSLVL